MLMTAKYDGANPAALKRLAASGAVLRPFPAEVMDGCWKAANDFYTELAAKNEWFKKLYDHFSAYRADHMGNLVYRKTARNFGPVMATAATTTIAQVRETGPIDPEAVVTPGIFVDRVVPVCR